MHENKFHGVKIQSGNPEIDAYLEKILNFYHSGKGNLFQFLLSLPLDDLIKILNSRDSEDGCWKDIAYHLALFSMFIEAGRKSNVLETDYEKIIKHLDAFYAVCILAIEQKNGTIKVYDKSYFFEPDKNLKIERL